MASPHVIFLHGLGDSGRGWAGVERQMGLELGWTFPTAPTAPVTCNGGMRMTSWMDLVKIPVEHGDPDDAASLDASTKIIHGMIEKLEADGVPSDKIVVGGTCIPIYYLRRPFWSCPLIMVKDS